MYCFQCRDSIDNAGGLQFKGCYHFLCTECLISAVIETTTLGLKCPAYNGFQRCKGRIKHELLEDMVPDEVYASYLDNVANSYSHNYGIYETEHLGSFPDECQQTTFPSFPNNSRLRRKTQRKQFKHTRLQLTEEDKTFGWAHQSLLFEDLVEKEGMSSRKASNFIERTPVLETRAVIECAVCADDAVPEGQGVVLKECLHMFCKNCLVNMIEFTEDATVKCPYIDGNYSCIYHLQEREIKALVSKEVYEKLLEKSLKLGEASMDNSFHCKTVDCLGWCVFDEGVEKFDCPVCRKQNCINCKAIHEGTCEDHKNRLLQNENDKLSEEAINELIRNGQAMNCPKCLTPCVKPTGCDWTQCVACKMEICWATKGPRWGPKGHGDTTGGCGCRSDAKKTPCHPQCGSCH